MEAGNGAFSVPIYTEAREQPVAYTYMISYLGPSAGL